MNIIKQFNQDLKKKGTNYLEDVCAQLIPTKDGTTKQGHYRTFVEQERKDEEYFTCYQGKLDAKDLTSEFVEKRFSKEYVNLNDFIDHLSTTLNQRGWIQAQMDLRKKFCKKETKYIFVHDSSIPEGTPEKKECERIKTEHIKDSYRGDPCLSPSYFNKIGTRRSLISAIDYLPSPTNFQKGDTLKVMGAYRFMCIPNTLTSLLRAGYNASVHNSGTID